MKVIAALLIVLSLLIGIVPQFTDCQAQGRELTLANGRNIPMKCHWTARAELGTALPILGVGVLLFAAKRKETLRALGVVGALLGILVILLPTVLIGVCGSPDMICNAFMDPFLVLSGSLVIVLSLVVAVRGLTMKASVEPATVVEQEVAG